MRAQMDIRLLRYFKRVAEIGSLTRAAAALGISQPALTRHMQQLEHDLRTVLFVRGRDGVRLTDTGMHLKERLDPLLDHVREIEEEIAAMTGEVQGDVSLGMPSSMHGVVTSPAAIRAASKLPGVRLRVIDGFDSFLHERLADGTTDLAIVMYDPEMQLAGVNQVPLVRERLFLVGLTPPPDASDPVDIRNLSDLRLVLPGEQNTLRRKIDQALRQQGIKPRIIEVDSFQTTYDLVRRGEAYSIAPSCALGAGSDGLWYAPMKRLMITWALGMQMKKQHSPAVAQVADIVRGYLDEWSKGNAWVAKA